MSKPKNLTDEQWSAIRCALADLQGSKEAVESYDPFLHDWDAHAETITELLEAFPELED